MRKNFEIKGFLTIALFFIFVLCMALAVSFSGTLKAKATALENPTESQFMMLDGAEVYLGGCGIKFTTEIEEGYYNAIKARYSSVKLCTEIAPLGRTPVVDENASDLVFTNGKAKFYGILNYSNIDETFIKEMGAIEMTAKAYVLADGQKIYANRNDTTRSMRAVANLALVKGNYADQTEKALLESYLGGITRQEGLKTLHSLETEVTFDSPVTGRLYVNAKRTDKFLLNEQIIDIKDYIGDNERNGQITVSVMGDNQYDVTSLQAEYKGIRLIYNDANGNLTTDYKIITPSGVSSTALAGKNLAYIVKEMTGVIIQSPRTNGVDGGYYVDGYNYMASESYLNDDSPYISIGYTNALASSGIIYDKAELEKTGGFMIATKDNNIYLFGGTAGDTSDSTYRQNSPCYAVDELLQMVFGFEVYGTLPQSIQDARDNEPYQKYVYDYEYNSGNEVYVSDVLNYKSLASIENRRIQYVSISGDKDGVYRSTYPEEDHILNVYAINYDDGTEKDYLSRIYAESDGYRFWKCSCGTTKIAKEQPTCTKTSCTTKQFKDETLTIEAYKQHKAFTCNSCYSIRAGFVEPTNCLNESCAIYAGGFSAVNNTTRSTWHTNFFWAPIGENYDEHPLWYGENATGDQRAENGKFTRQLCFNAHGNASEREAMVDTFVEKVKNTLKVYEGQLDTNKTYAMTISNHDATDHCVCEYCLASYEKYYDASSKIDGTSYEYNGTMSGLQIEFINEVAKKVQDYIDTLSADEKVNLTFMPFAYHIVEKENTVNGNIVKFNVDQIAPVKWDEASEKWVAIDVTPYKGENVCTSIFLVTDHDKVFNLPKDENGNYKEFDGTDYLYSEVKNPDGDIKHEYNEQRRLIQQWKDYLGDTQIYFWYNSQEHIYSTVPCYSEELFSEDFYEFLIGEDGNDIKWIFNYNTESLNAGSAYHNLRLYMTTKLNWDATLSPKKLRDAWFKGIFKNEAVREKMITAFNYEMNMAIKAKYSYTNAKVPDAVLEAGSHKETYTTYVGVYGNNFSIDDLLTLYAMYQAVYDEIQNESDERLKQEMTAYLYNEWYFPIEMLIRFHLNDVAIKDIQSQLITKFEEILDVTGIDVAEVLPEQVLENAKVELVVQKVQLAEDGVYVAPVVVEDYKPIVEYSDIYDQETRTITLDSTTDGLGYRLGLRIINDDGTYKEAKIFSSDISYQFASLEADEGLRLSSDNMVCYKQYYSTGYKPASKANIYDVHITFSLDANANRLRETSIFNVKVEIK